MVERPGKITFNEDHCVSLKDILVSFNAPISEEHGWAICYQCAKCFRNALVSDRARCRVVSQLDQVLIHRDGHVHPNSIFAGEREKQGENGPPTEHSVVAGLGLTLYRALDYGMDTDEERHLSPELERLIQYMASTGGEDRLLNETDDEGIERDAADSFEDSNHHSSSLSLVIQECTVHLGCGGTQEADSHYKAVCRALVAEALELSFFLDNVSVGQIRQQHLEQQHLDQLNCRDWASLWLQLIRELRLGVQLKKVSYSRKPIEYELTPYEMLMDDIRSRRYKLNKVMIDGTIPQRVKKDAHAIILEFIRSRPPLKKASERKLNPPKPVYRSPRESLMEDIKQGHAKLSPVHRNWVKLGRWNKSYKIKSMKNTAKKKF